MTRGVGTNAKSINQELDQLIRARDPGVYEIDLGPFSASAADDRSATARDHSW